ADDVLTPIDRDRGPNAPAELEYAVDRDAVDGQDQEQPQRGDHACTSSSSASWLSAACCSFVERFGSLTGTSSNRNFSPAKTANSARGRPVTTIAIIPKMIVR